MPVSLVGAVLVAGDTPMPPAHQAGDLLIAYAVRTTDNTLASAPSGWTTFQTSVGGPQSMRCAWRLATDGATPGGPWTGATVVGISVFRGADPAQPIGASTFTNSTDTLPVFPVPALQRTEGSSWVWGAWTHMAASNMGEAPAGLVLRGAVGSGPMSAMFDTGGGVQAWSGGGITANAFGQWRSVMAEIRAEHRAFAGAGQLGVVGLLQGAAAVVFDGIRRVARGEMLVRATLAGHGVVGASVGRLVPARTRTLRLPGRPLMWDAKRPDDRERVGLDLTPLLVRIDGSSESLVAVLWTAPPGLVLHAQGLNGSVAVAEISGGTAGVDYALDCAVITNTGRRLTMRVRLPVRAP